MQRSKRRYDTCKCQRCADPIRFSAPYPPEDICHIPLLLLQIYATANLHHNPRDTWMTMACLWFGGV